MAFIPPHDNPIIKALTSIGKLPDNCANARINMPATGELTITYEVYLSMEDLQALNVALGVELEQQM